MTAPSHHRAGSSVARRVTRLILPNRQPHTPVAPAFSRSALRARRSQRARRLRDGAVRIDVDVVALRRAQDLLAGPFPGRLALELGLVEARDGVAHMRGVVDRKVLATLAI